MTKILITGALGHIGSALIREIPLSFPEARLCLADNLLTNRYCSLFSFPHDVEYYQIDIFDKDFSNLVKESSVVVHLAAITDMTSSHNNSSEVERINFEGLCCVAELCKQHFVPLIFISTTSVYAGHNGILNEDITPITNNLSPYAESKFKAEEFLKSTEDLIWTTLRLGTIVGVSPGMRFHTAVNKFIWQTVLRQDITVWETALDQLRPYLTLSDAVSAITKIISLILSTEKDTVQRQIYNIATENTTVRSIFERLKNYRPSCSISLVKSAVMNESSFGVDNIKISSLGITTQSSLDSEISKTFDLFDKINNY